MKPFYSIQELSDILDKDNYSVSNGLVAAGILSYFNGKTVDLADYDCFRPIYNGECIVINLASHPPTPDTIIVSADALPESWRKSIEIAEQDTTNNDSVDTGISQSESTVSAVQQKAGKATNSDTAATPYENVCDETTLPNPNTEPSTSLRGVTKQEILSVEWNLPNGAPLLENILKKYPNGLQRHVLRMARWELGQPAPTIGIRHNWPAALLPRRQRRNGSPTRTR